MDLVDFLNRYTSEVYDARDAEAARRFIADPCIRHESGERIVMSIEENVARIASFLAEYPNATFANAKVVADGENVVTCYNLDFGNGTVVSAIEVFRIVDGKITETWNTHPATGAWG